MMTAFHALAIAVAVLHLAFITFVVAGGVGVLYRPRLAWAHAPSAAYGAAVMLAGWTCPLTPLENWLRSLAGEAPYGGGFIEHYWAAAFGGESFSSWTPWVLGLFVLAVNAVLYGLLLARRG